MKITLNRQQEEFLKEQVESGKFATPEEVINVAFQLLQNLTDEHQQWIEETRDQVKQGIAELDEGNGKDGETIVNEILARFKQARQVQS